MLGVRHVNTLGKQRRLNCPQIHISQTRQTNDRDRAVGQRPPQATQSISSLLNIRPQIGAEFWLGAQQFKRRASRRRDRQSRLRTIEYDEARTAHKCEDAGTEHEDVEYNWEFSFTDSGIAFRIYKNYTVFCLSSI